MDTSVEMMYTLLLLLKLAASVSLAWDAGIPTVTPVAYFTMYRQDGCVASTPFAKLDDVPANTQTYTATGLADGEVYCYRVTARGPNSEESIPSNIVIYLTPHTPPPLPPINLRVVSTLVHGQQVTLILRWDAWVSGGAVMVYTIYRQTACQQGFTNVGSVLGTVTDFTDKTAVVGQVYCYYVKASASGQESTPSNIIRFQCIKSKSAFKTCQ